MARLVSLTVLTALIVFLGITFFHVIAPFLLPLFLAGVTAVLCQPIYRYFRLKVNHRPRLAAGLTAAAVLAIVLIPLLVGTFIGSVQLYTLAQETLFSPEWNKAVKTIRAELEIDRIAERLDPYIVGEIDAEKLQTQIQTNLRNVLTSLAQRSLGLAKGALGVLGSMVAALVSLLMFVIALYYFLADGPALLAAAEGLIPVHVEYQRQLLLQFDKVIRAVVMATFLAAVAQGFCTAAALYVFGFHRFFIIIFIVATFASLIPLAGTWLIWGPCAVWLAYQGDWGQAMVLTLFGAIVIGMMDNVIRSYVLHSDAKLHPLLAFVSVLGGLQVMGLWGVFIGPTVACFLHTLVKVFNTELKQFSKERFAQAVQQPAAIEATPARLERDVAAQAGQVSDRQPASTASDEADAIEPAATDAAQPTRKRASRSRSRRKRTRSRRAKGEPGKSG